jgi:predicted GIY-YIG superfamily endonuclease
MYSVYWIRYKEHIDPHNEGYIGISKDPLTRFKEHKNSRDNNKVRGAIKNGANIEIIKNNLSLLEALELEKFYRPNELIGWNFCQGGQLPPNKKGYKYKEGKQVLIGENRTDSQKESSKKHSERMKGNIPWNKGKTGFKGPVKSCVYKGIEFISRKEAASYFGVSISAVTLWVKKHSN